MTRAQSQGPLPQAVETLARHYHSETGMTLSPEEAVREADDLLCLIRLLGEHGNRGVADLDLLNDPGLVQCE